MLKHFNYLWTGYFNNGHIIEQPEDDKYSKHDDNSEYNPSSFRDLLEYTESKLVLFKLKSKDKEILVNLITGDITINDVVFTTNDVVNPKLIYYRDIEKDFINGQPIDERIVAYNVGYEYLINGKNKQNIIRIPVNVSDNSR